MPIIFPVLSLCFLNLSGWWDAPAEATEPALLDAMSTNELASCDVIVTCQGRIYEISVRTTRIRDGADTD